MGAFSTGRFAKGLLAFVATFVAAVLAVGAPNARADEYQPGYPKLGQDSELVYGHDLYRDGALGTQLLTVHTDDRGGRILAYCIELDVHSNWGGELQQTDFSAFPGSNEFAKNPQVRSKVSWIIHRSYPQTGVAQVAAAAGVPGLTEREAITATQAAIWHLTDNFAFNGLHSWEEPRHDTASERAQRVKKLYDYLLGPANAGLPESSGPSVEVTAPKAPGTSGELVGPIRLTATQQTVALATLPYPLVDAQGNEVDGPVPEGSRRRARREGRHHRQPHRGHPHEPPPGRPERTLADPDHRQDQAGHRNRPGRGQLGPCEGSESFSQPVALTEPVALTDAVSEHPDARAGHPGQKTGPAEDRQLRRSTVRP